MQEERYIATVDFGTSVISLSVSMVTAQDTKNVYFGKCNSEGIMNGLIVNSRNVANCLRPLIEEAESQLEKKINKLVVNWPRANVKCLPINVSLTRPNPDTSVSKDDIIYLKDTARDQLASQLSDSDDIYDIVPLSYSIDDLYQATEDDIEGATSEKIEGNFLAFVGRSKVRKGILKVIDELDGVSVASFCFTPAYPSRFVINPEEMMHGVALIEIGGAITSVSVYYKGVIRYFRSFAFGGKDITNDIRTEGNLTLSLAENIKKGFGSCMPDKLYTLEDKCLYITRSTGPSSTVQVKYLAEIINRRMLEIANTCIYLLGESGYADKLPCGIVLCGGGARLLSCHSLFYNLSGLRTRVALPHYFESTEECTHETMLLFAKKDLSLNCAEEIGLKKPEMPIHEAEPEAEPSLFAKGEIEEVKAADHGNAPKERKKVEKKEKETEKSGNIFGRFLNVVGNAFENGYKNAGEDNENE